MKQYEKDAVELQVFGFIPDWSMIGSAEYAEKELQGFKFRGPGWYINKTDTLLVLPYAADDDGAQCKDLYRVCVYNNRNPADAFNWIVNAPTRVDERK